MNIKKVALLILFFLTIVLTSPKTSNAFDLQESLTSENSIITKVAEGLEYFFAFKIENKVQVLEKHAEKRLVMAQEHAEEGNNERVQNLMQNYLQIKEKQDGLLEQTDGQVLGAIAEKTVEQQKTIEEIKTKTSNEIKQEIVQVQERVINQVAKRIVVVNGKEGQTEFFQKVEHVWAPGTGPGGEAGVVIEGGQMQFAPGTSFGGPSGADIKTNVVETGGGENNVVESGNGGGFAPGTGPGNDKGNTIDPGTVDPGNPGSNPQVIDP